MAEGKDGYANFRLCEIRYANQIFRVKKVKPDPFLLLYTGIYSAEQRVK